MFHFRGFSLYHEKSTLKIGTDSVLLASVVPAEDPRSVLDIGCGCGIIGFCLAYKMGFERKKNPAKRRLLPETQITGIDIDKASILEARANMEIFPAYRNLRMEFQETSLQELSVSFNKNYDLIVSNPPYFHNLLKPAHEKKRKSKHGDHNLPLEELFLGINRLLSPSGQCYLIFPPEVQQEFRDIAAGSLFVNYQWSIHAHPGKISRLICCYGKKPAIVPGKEDIFIRDDQLNFTEAYQNITRQFYLW